MKKFEYRIDKNDAPNGWLSLARCRQVYDQRGAEGWELVAIQDDTTVWKREIEEPVGGYVQ